MKVLNIKQTIKEHYFVNPSSKLRVRELERKLKLPLPSIIRYCKELEQENILQTIIMGNVKFYTSSKTEKYRLEKKLFNLKQIYDSKLIEYLKFELSNPVIILFGSYSKGEDTEESDIDLYIETTSKIPNLERFEKKLKRTIQLFKHKNIEELQNHHLANNIVNGITLNNYLEVFK